MVFRWNIELYVGPVDVGFFVEEVEYVCYRGGIGTCVCCFGKEKVRAYSSPFDIYKPFELEI